MAPSTVLIVGATGQQGGAVLKALLSYPKPPKILALTRNTTSPRAVALAASHKAQGLELLQGDLQHPAGIFAARPPRSIDALFLVTTPPKEAAHALPFLAAAAAHGVQHVVFSSVDRGGEPRSWANPTAVPQFRDKHAVDVHLRDGLPAGVRWTMLRPVSFMENLDGAVPCALTTGMWAVALRPATKLQMVAVRDIGVWAARALMRPDEFAGRAVGLAGVEMTLGQVKAVFRRVVGREPPQAWGIVARVLMWAIGMVGKMFAWFESEGYGVDIAKLKAEDGDMMNLERWLRTESRYWKGQVKV